MERLDFAQWLSDELKQHGWNRAQFARLTGISAPQITRILNREQRPGPDSINAIASFLKKKPASLYQLAGVMTPEGNGIEDTDAETLYDKIVSLSPDLRDRAADFVNILVQLKSQNEQISNGTTEARSRRTRR
jgi:transcriptional regulator with XRE-family HTH domain